ncbi:MAG: CBS domain-containing protein [Chloroflexi bacterium]|nr:CBS domain-containing protein [Chloroflexota bacterium]
MDPTYRIGKLASANKPPLSVKLDMKLEVATSLMLLHDFSQLPVMETERDVRGIISWETIGSRLALGQVCKNVRDCMEPHHEISVEVSLFSIIDTIVMHEYVLIRDSTNKICGIVTTSDLSQQFRQLGEPFLLLGEIENYIRHLIQDKFTIADLEKTRNPSDKGRKITSVFDLTFGEYIRLLQIPIHWSKLKLLIDRGVFIEYLDKVRLIRNDVMHFDPDGIPESDLAKLREFVHFLQGLSTLGVM